MTAEVPAGIFVGREDALVRFAAATEHVRLLVVYGPGGVGKTAFMARAATEFASRRGARKFIHACRSGESLGSVVAALFGRESGRPAIETLAEAAVASPILICLDDVHKTGGTSLVRELCEVVVSEHPIWVCTTSRERLTLSMPGLDHLALRLDGLATPSAQELWASLECLYGPGCMPFEEALRRSGGSPFALRQLFSRRSEAGSHDTLEILQLPEGPRALLRRLAAARGPVAVSELEGAEERQALEVLTRRFLVELQPANDKLKLHDLVREAVLLFSPPQPEDHRHGLRSALASGDSMEALYHALHCGDDAVGVRLLEDHATLFNRVRPSDSVVDRDLLSALDGFAARRPLTSSLRLLRAHLIGRQSSIAAARHELRALADVVDEPMVDLSLGELALFTGELDEALLRCGRIAQDPQMHVVGRVWALVLWIEGLRERGRFAEAERLVAERATDFDAIGPFGSWLKALIEAYLDRESEHYERALRALERAAAAWAACTNVLTTLGTVDPIIQTFVVGTAPVHEALAQLIGAAAGTPAHRSKSGKVFFHDTPVFRLFARTLLAEELVFRGELQAAASTAAETLAAAESTGFAVLAGWATGVWARAMLGLGRGDEALAPVLARLQVARTMRLHPMILRLSTIIAAARIARGEPEVVAELVASAGDGSDGTAQIMAGNRARLAALATYAAALAGHPGSALKPVGGEGHDRCEAQLDLIEALLATKRPDDALALVAEVAQVAGRASWRYLECRALGLQAEAAFLVGRFDDAARLVALVGDAAWQGGYAAVQARVGLVAAALARLGGDREACVRSLAQVEEIATRHHLVPELRAADEARKGSLGVGRAAHSPESGQLSARLGLLDPACYRLRTVQTVRWLTLTQAATIAASHDHRPFIDLTKGIVRIERRESKLSKSPMLLSLLAVLATSEGVVPSEQIARSVWRIEYHPLRHRSRLVMAIARLRDLIGEDAVEARDDGYRLTLTDCRVLDLPEPGAPPPEE